jgi:hypothetical protein
LARVLALNQARVDCRIRGQIQVQARGWSGHVFRVGQVSAHPSDQLERAERFGQILGHPETQPVQDVVFLAQPGNHENHGRHGPRAVEVIDQLHDLETGAAGQVHIQDRQRRAVLLEPFEGFRHGLERHDSQSLSLENDGEEFSGGGIVFNDQCCAGVLGHCGYSFTI